MRQGLMLIWYAALFYCAPFLLWMLWAAVVKAPLAFGLLALFGGVGSIANALLMQRAANHRAEALRATAPSAPVPPGGWGGQTPVRVTHWHEAVGPQLRRPPWASLQGATELRARAFRPGSRTGRSA